jgi:hypothetical protein
MYKYSMFTHKFSKKGIFYLGCVKKQKNISKIVILSVNICLF